MYETKANMHQYLTMMKFAIAVVCLVFLSIQEGNSLPEYFKKCNEKGDKLSACLTSSANKGWPEFMKGNKKYHLFPLNPLHVPYMHLNVDDILLATIKNATFAGFDTVVFKDISIDFVKKRCTIKFDQPMYNLNGNYVVDGHLLGVQLVGEGFGILTIDRGHYDYYFDFEIEERYGLSYVVIKHSDLDISPEGVTYSLDKLFNTNKKTIKDVNQFLNDNWNSVFKFVKGSLGKLFAQTYSDVLQNFFDKLPLEDFFKE